MTGIFLWLDSLINQIWLNNQFQLNLMTLLTSLNSIPYNAAGYAMIPQACMSTIQQALLAGVIRAGVPLSSGQAQQVNNMAGYRIDDIILAQGWYFQVQPATPQVRPPRGSPVCYFFTATDSRSRPLCLIRSNSSKHNQQHRGFILWARSRVRMLFSCSA